MKNKRAGFFGLMAGLLVLCVPALAHHGGSEYDQDHPVTLKGSVTEFDWNNPHCQIFVDVKDDKGKVVSWSLETYAPAVMKRAGWSRETLHAGDEVTITVIPSKRGNPVGMVRKVVLPSGKELSGGILGEQPPQ
ncbi:MAG TPA: DUF6152 family protein [Candidatus Acidoferrales bacterium]|nr:DUF6152 family protein [Candidatus Acidoferrales bacterium]